MYFDCVAQFTKMLRNLDGWIEKGLAHAKAKSFDPSVLMTARLAPDQYNFIRQVQAACDAAKFAGSRLTGRDAPSFADTETTADEIRARIANTVAFLDGLTAADFEGAAERVVALPFIPGKGLAGRHYLAELAMPNFFFHVTTAYAILRHNGVDLGKIDYIGGLSLRDA
jgi:hypothetical protein